MKGAKYFFVMFFFSLILFSHAHLIRDAHAEGIFAKTVPDFSLNDPAGIHYTKNQLITKGIVILVTAPIFKNKGAQEGWSKFLPDAKGHSKGHLIFLEDLSASSFKGMALSGMKKDYQPGIEPILLIDESGSVREKFGVEKEKNVVLVYDSKGKLVYQETGKPNAMSAGEIWKKVN